MKPLSLALWLLAAVSAFASLEASQLDVATTPRRRLSVAVDSPEYAASARVAAIADTRELITNGPRMITIDSVKYPYFFGPRAKPGSLALLTQVQEHRVLQAFKSVITPDMVSIAVNRSASLRSLGDIADLYDQAQTIADKPLSAHDRDEVFGLQRHTIKAFALREATPADLAGAPLALSDWQLMKRCGMGRAALQLTHALFIESFRDVAKYNDPAAPHKYVPNVEGFFCVHAESQRLLPIEIRLLDTGLAYTPLDSPAEWTFAKMALETASVSYHQINHLADTHALTIPLRVEMMRTMSEDHPVRALLQRHIFSDFGLEIAVDVVLMNVSTPLDKTYGWGATGSTQFLWDQTSKGISVKGNAFFEDVRARGLDHLPGHKYVAYGTLYHNAIASFVAKYLEVFYASDADVQRDIELQGWAKAANTIPHLRDFPTAFHTKAQVQEIVTHIIFATCVQHHAMNGAATWHGLSVPYSSTALWAPLPTEKQPAGKTLNLRDFVMPTHLLPTALAMQSGYFRRVPSTETLFNAYAAEPFTNEPALQPALDEFQDAMQTIDDIIVSREAGEPHPYMLLRPKELPYFIWA